MTAMREVWINGRWPLMLPEHRAARDSWPWWEATRLAAMATVIGPESVVYDIGGEEGDFPALWASWGARVAIAEPNPRVWPNIRAIFEGNTVEAETDTRGLTEQRPLSDWVVATYAGFMGERPSEGCDEAGAAGLATLPNGKRSDVWPPSAYGEVIGDHGFCQLGERPDLPTTTIDRWMAVAMPPPTVITMDVEGSELFVLNGAIGTLREYRPEVFVSIHPEFMEHHYGLAGGDGAVELIRSFMERVGYERDRHVYLCTDHEIHYWFRP